MRLFLLITLPLSALLLSCNNWKNVNDFAGVYRYETENMGGSIVIRPMTEERFEFSIAVGTSDGCTGELDGVATITGNRKARFSIENCEEITFRFSNQTLEVVEKGCDEFHGVRCNFAGKYTRE